jgi:hypothetical protein
MPRVKTFFAVLGGAAAGAGVTWLVMGGWKKLATKLALGQALPSGGDLAVHLRQIRRYAFAASQDQSPVVGLTHASYAAILLDTLEEIVGAEAIIASGFDVKKLRKFIVAQQDRHGEALQKCDPHLQKVLLIEKADGRKRTPGFIVAGAPIAAPRGA